MRTKKVNRYWCDFCGKSGLSASHMARHERFCTMNPKRQCRMCGRLEKEQQPIETLKGTLLGFFGFVTGEQIAGKFPRITKLHRRRRELEDMLFDGPAEKDTAALNAAVHQLMAITSCPACTMAALRQCRIPVPCATEFDFNEECKKMWVMVNERGLL